MMTIQGAIKEIDNLIDSKDIPIYYKASLKKIRETIIDEFNPRLHKPSEELSETEQGGLMSAT